MLAGLLLRGSGGGQVWSLYAGTVLAGAGIALAGTLLPGVVKTVFPARRSGLGTGLTMVAMMGLAAVASAASVPLADVLGGWSASLLAWAPLAALALLTWVPIARAARRHAVPDTPQPDVSHALPWASVTAWLLAIFLACQSWQFYSSLAWLAPTYESVGWTARDAGLLMAVFTGAQLVSGLIAPTLLDHVRDARVLLVGATLLGGSGEVGVWLAPEAAPWAVGAPARGGAGRLLRARPRPARAVRRDAAGQRPAHRDGVPRQLHDRVVRPGDDGRRRGRHRQLRPRVGAARARLGAAARSSRCGCTRGCRRWAQGPADPSAPTALDGAATPPVARARALATTTTAVATCGGHDRRCAPSIRTRCPPRAMAASPVRPGAGGRHRSPSPDPLHATGGPSARTRGR